MHVGGRLVAEVESGRLGALGGAAAAGRMTTAGAAEDEARPGGNVAPTDRELADRARSGEVAAFGTLVDRHRGAVFRTALAALGDPAEAEDTAQDACILAFRRLGSFRNESSFKTWLLAIAWRQALTRRRAPWRRFRQRPVEWAPKGPADGPAAGDVMHEVAAPGTSAEQHLLQGERVQAVVAAIRALSSRYRDCLLLSASGEHSYEEIARMVGVRVGTVKWRVSEARRKVRERLLAGGWDHV
jgi:RNA polymerase sigma-70 factor (ECF subfamily)